MSTLVHHISRSVIDPNASERDRNIFPRFDNLRPAVLLSICEAIRLGGKKANGAGCPVGGLAGSFTLSRKVCDGADVGTFVWEISGVEAFADVGEVVA
jgi:hypothetical protein